MHTLSTLIFLGILCTTTCSAHWIFEPEDRAQWRAARHTWYDDVLCSEEHVLDSEEEEDTSSMQLDVPSVVGLPTGLTVEISPAFGLIQAQAILSGVTRENMHFLKELVLDLPAHYAVTVMGNFWPLDLPLLHGATWVTLTMQQEGLLDVSGVPEAGVPLRQLTLQFVGDARPEVRRTLLEMLLARGDILTTMLVVTPVWTLREQWRSHGQEMLLFNTSEEPICRDWEEMALLKALRRVTREGNAIGAAKDALLAIRDELRANSFGFQWDQEKQAIECAAFMFSQSQEGMPGSVTAMRDVVLPHALLMQRNSPRNPGHRNDGAV